MSLLLDHGHRHARDYPLGMVYEEALLVVERMNQEEAGRAALMHVVGLAVMSKEGTKALKKILGDMTNG